MILLKEYYDDRLMVFKTGCFIGKLADYKGFFYRDINYDMVRKNINAYKNRYNL